MEEIKDEYIVIRVSKREKNNIKRRAERRGFKLSLYIRQKLGLSIRA